MAQSIGHLESVYHALGSKGMEFYWKENNRTAHQSDIFNYRTRQFFPGGQALKSFKKTEHGLR